MLLIDWWNWFHYNYIYAPKRMKHLKQERKERRQWRSHMRRGRFDDILGDIKDHDFNSGLSSNDVWDSRPMKTIKIKVKPSTLREVFDKRIKEQRQKELSDRLRRRPIKPPPPPTPPGIRRR